MDKSEKMLAAFQTESSLVGVEKLRPDNLYVEVRREFDRRLSFIIQLLGESHPYVAYYYNKVNRQSKEYIDATAYILNRNIRKWNARLNEVSGTSGKIDVKTATVNTVFMDVFRLEVISDLAETISIILNGGDFDPSGRVPVKYSVNSQVKTTLLGQGSDQLVDARALVGKDGILPGFKDKNVPWDYVLLFDPKTDNKDYQEWIKSRPYDLIRGVYNGRFWIPEELIEEMGRLEQIILSVTSNCFWAGGMDKPHDPGELTAVARWGWTNNVGLSNTFSGWAWPSFAHELRHVADFRLTAGLPVSVVAFESGAFCDQLDVEDICSSSHDQKESTRSYLAPYAKIITGVDFGKTHFETHYERISKTRFNSLDPKDQQHILDVLAVTE